MPGNLMPQPGKSRGRSADQRTYEFKLREGCEVPNGTRSPRGRCSPALQGVQGVQGQGARITIVDLYRCASTPRALPRLHGLLWHAGDGDELGGAQRYIEKVGDDGFKKAADRAGAVQVREPYSGVDLVMEAFEG